MVNAGAGGTWLLDPTDLTIDANAATTIAGSLNAGTNVTEMTVMSGAASGSGVQTAGAGDITVAAPISWTGTGILSLLSFNSVNIDAPITIGGAGGLSIYTNYAADGGTGTLNFNGGSVSYTQGAGGSLSILGNPYTLVFDLATLGSDIAANAGGYYALGASINAAGTTYTTEPVTYPFAGTFEGLGNSISNLTINSPDNPVGLFAEQYGGTIRDIGLVGGSVTATGNAATVGSLVGYVLGGTIVNATSSVTVTGSGGAAGGLVGQFGSAIITNSSATGTVTDQSAGGIAGGLVGISTINAGFGITPTITNSYATGAVAGEEFAGGLVGETNGFVGTNVYATGAVTVGAGGYGGGLFGISLGATLTNVYSTGPVQGVGATIGGLIGYEGGTVTNGYWNIDRSGVTAATGNNANSGITGLSAATSSPFTAASYGGFTFTTTPGAAGNAWVIVDVDGTLNNANGAAGGTLPMLASEYATTIVNAHQLQLMAMAPNASYTLAGSIAAAATGSSTSITTGADVWGQNGFIPVGNPAAQFRGSFNGAGYTINNLTVNTPYDAGLFGDVSTGSIQNVGLVGGSVTGTGNGSGNGVIGGGNVGFLAGVTAGPVTNSYVTGSVTGATGTTGGLIGFSNGLVTNSYATGPVTGVSGDIGGLIGEAFANVSGSHATGAVSGGGSVGGLAGLASIVQLTNSYATGNVTGTGNLGGLVGESTNGTISGSYATGNVTASAASNVGGLVGYVFGGGIPGSVTIGNTYATGAVSASGEPSNVGGLIGQTYYDIVISTSYATGTVTLTGGSGNIGGLVGNLYFVSSVTASYATGNVTGSGSVGGLVGLASDESTSVANAITASYATGTVSGSGTVGGLLGDNTDGAVVGSYATGAVTLLSGSYGAGSVGGLVGFNSSVGTIASSYATGTVTYASSQGSSGGLVGTNIGGITGSYATGTVVSAGYGGTLGGLVGANETGGTIASSYATGAISATGSGGYDSIANAVGGLAGANEGSITNSYATGAAVTNAGTSYVGGLVGVNTGSIANSYATGAAVAVGRDSDVGGLAGLNAAGSIATSYSAGPVVATAPYVGGLVGANTGSITSAYWDIDRALTSVGVGHGSATGATGLSGAAVFNAASYVGFSFTTTPGAAGNAWAMLDLDGSLNGANGGTLPMLASEYATTIVNAHQLQLMALAPGAAYTLANNIDATATGSSISPATGADVWGPAGFIPVGNAATPFVGLFEGNTFTIDGLTINSPAAAVGLFGVANAEIQDVGLIGGSVTGTAAGANVGALAGSVNDGEVSNVYATVPVSGAGNVGGLIGLNTGQLIDVYATGAVTGSSATNIGGLVGTNSGNISSSYATGAVSGGINVQSAGGLVGSNGGSGQLDIVYATGAVTTPVAAMGGLVGSNAGFVSTAYATGPVGYSSESGGVAGFNTGNFTNVYWNIDRSGHNVAVGAVVVNGLAEPAPTTAGTTGLSAATASPLTAASYAGFTFTATPGTPNAWVIVDVDGTLNNAGGPGATLPMLASEYSTTIVNAHQLQLVAMAPGANYKLATNIDASATGTGISAGVVNGGYLGTDVWGAGGFVPLGGNGAAPFTGSFNGQGYAISGLAISSSEPNVGLFGQIGAANQPSPNGIVTNVGLLDASVSAHRGAANYGNAVGALVGMNYGTIGYSYATGAVVATNVENVGGLVGFSFDGTITNSYETASVSVLGASYLVGGFVGQNTYTSISNAYATGSVTSSYGSNGFAGFDNSPTTNVYSSGSVSGNPNSTGFIPQDYPVSGGYYDADRSAASNARSAGTGLSGAAAFTASSYAGFTFTNTPGTQGNAWVIVDVDGTLNNAGGAAGATLPMLASEYNATNIVNAHQLQLLSMAPGASYTLGKNIDASATGSSTSYATGSDVWGSAGFAPLGGISFTGVLNGRGLTISGLTINSAQSNAGLFGTNNGIVQNLVLSGGAITGNLPIDGTGALAGTNGGLIANVTTTAPVQGAGNSLGGVAGDNPGALLNVAAQGSVTDSGFGDAVGGAAGSNTGEVVQTYAVGAVTGAAVDTSGGAIGGLVGANSGLVTLSYAAGTISGGSLASIGGLAGSNAGTILDAYATGAVGGGEAAVVGGLVGTNSGTGAITDTYATGALSGGGTLGGLVAVSTGTVGASYWDETMAGTATSAAGTGLTTLQFLTQGPVAGAAFDTSIVWVGGYAYPVLQALPYVLVTATGTQVYGTSNATYTVTGATDQNGANASALVNTASTSFLTSATAASPVAGDPYVLGGTGGTVRLGYQLTYTGAFTVTPLAVTPETAGLTGSASKTYDGTTTATLTQANYTLNGGTAPSGVTVNATSTLYATPDAGSGITVTASGLSLGGSNASNYMLTSTTASAAIGIINAAPLTVAGGKVYDATTGFTVAQLGVSGAVNGESVSLTSGTGTAASANVGAYSGSTLSGLAITVTGGNALASNYALPATGTLSITPEPVTIAAAPNTRTYDGTTSAAATPTVTSGTIYDSVTLSEGYATPNAGTGLTLTPSAAIANAGNYSITYAPSTAGIINPAPLTVAGGKVYDATTGFAVGQLAVAGAVNGESVSLTSGTGTAASANVGAYSGSTLAGLAVTVTGGNALASNYALPATGTLTITPEPITIAAAPNTKAYDGTISAAATPTVTAGTLYSGATLSETYATPNAGTGLTLTPMLANAGNYSITYAPSTAGIINPAPLTVAGGKVYDATTGFTVAQLGVSGAVNGESVSLTSGTGTAASANVGAYSGSTLAGLAVTVTGGNALASNYALPATGTLTIAPEPITIAAAPNTRTYDGTTSAAATPTVTAGTIYDSATLSEGYATPNAGTGLTLTPSAAIANAGNYSITYAPSTAGIINPAPLTVAGGKVYDATTGFTVGQLGVAGAVNGESVNLTAGTGTAASANVGAYSGSTLAGLAITVTGGNALAANYALPATGTLSITPEPITIAAAPNTRTYDGTTSAAATPTVTSGTLYDSATLSEGYATPNAGTGLTLTPSAAIANAGNYSITYAPSTAGIINPAPLTVAGGKVYDATTGFTVGQLGVAGAVNGESVSLTSGTGTAASANVGAYSGSTLAGLAVTVTGGNALASNYALPATGTLTITPEPITIAAAPNTRTYDGTTSAAATPTVTAGTLYSGATLSETYATPNAGTGLTLTPMLANAGNYSITYAPSTAGIINPAPLTVAGGKIYDATTGFTVGQLGVAGAVNGESVSLTSGNGTAASANVGAYSGSTLSGLAITVTGGNALASNYALPATGTLTITPEPITIAAAPNTRTYDGTTAAAATPTVTSGTLYDSVTLSEGYATPNAGTGLTLTPSAAIANAGNYSITYAPSTAGIINPAPLTVAGGKVYDATTGFTPSANSPWQAR